MQAESVLKQLKSYNVVFENRYTGKTKNILSRYAGAIKPHNYLQKYIF